MLSLQEEERLRKRLLSILRQNGELLQLYYDTYGFTPIDRLLDYIRTLKGFGYVNRHAVLQVVENDPKRQIEWDGGALVRATYGFLPTKNQSRWVQITPPDVLYYGTHSKLVGQVMASGLLPIASDFVQAAFRPDAIGAPGNSLQLLAVKARAASEAGVRFFQVNEWYCLSDVIPPGYLEDYLS